MGSILMPILGMVTNSQNFRDMQRYSNTGRDSSVAAFEIGSDYIRVK